MKVLFLTPWYPSEQDAMSGLFVQKHAEAVRAQGCDVRVIFSSSLWDSTRQYLRLRREGWIPNIVQLNVIQKQGVLALYLWKKYHIPYVIVEHWSGYLPENGQFKRFSVLKQDIYRQIARNAQMLLTVSDRHAQAMRDCGIQAKQWGRIHNVVDDFFFEPSRPQHLDISISRKTLLHVSCFDERSKNVKGLLRAAKRLSERRQDWRLVLVGTGIDYKETRAYASELAIPENLLEWTGELTPRQVAEQMHNADAFVLSSRYETYSVVLAEAAAAGLPILSTPVGIAEEVTDLIVPQEIAQHHPGKFAEFMESILWNEKITNQFTADAIGRKLVSIYDSCLHRDI